MTESAMSEEADPLYRPLGGIEPWVDAPVDDAAWAQAFEELGARRAESPDWSDMVSRGARLAAAHQSGALDGMHDARPALVQALLAGEATLAAVDGDERRHLVANHQALLLACESPVSEVAIRRIHEVACRPQLTHRVQVEDRVQDHVLAGGDYKHHPNHRRLPGGGWVATAPVALVGQEMAGLVETAAGSRFAALHPVVQAACLHHALTHVQPFADGNGRVARALAGATLLRAVAVPLLVPANDDDDAGTPAASVAFVQRAGIELARRLTDLHRAGVGSAALGRWRAEADAAEVLRNALERAVPEALDRYRGGRADVSSATVSRHPEGVAIRVPLEARPPVEEVLTVDAHPLEGGPQTLRAREAGARLEAGSALEPWLDRVVSILALRVAAELEEPD